MGGTTSQLYRGGVASKGSKQNLFPKSGPAERATCSQEDGGSGLSARHVPGTCLGGW